MRTSLATLLITVAMAASAETNRNAPVLTGYAEFGGRHSRSPSASYLITSNDLPARNASGSRLACMKSS